MIVSRSCTMHPKSPSSTIGGTVLKKSDDLVILGVLFDSKMTSENRLRSVSRTASQRLCISRMPFWIFHERSLLGRWFLWFVLPVLEYCSAVCRSAAVTHYKLPVVSGQFLTGDVFECEIAHRRPMSVLCMLHLIRWSPMHILNGALPVSHVLVRITRCALVAHRYTYAPPRCRISLYRRIIYGVWHVFLMFGNVPTIIVYLWRLLFAEWLNYCLNCIGLILSYHYLIICWGRI